MRKKKRKAKAKTVRKIKAEAMPVTAMRTRRIFTQEQLDALEKARIDPALVKGYRLPKPEKPKLKGPDVEELIGRPLAELCKAILLFETHAKKNTDDRGIEYQKLAAHVRNMIWMSKYSEAEK